MGLKRVRDKKTLCVSNVEPLPLCLLGSATEETMWNSVSVSTPSLMEVVRCCEPVPHIL